MKAVPMPTHMFRSIMVDEITRTIRGQSLKALIAMEGVSGFVVVLTYQGTLTGPEFVTAVAHFKAILCPHNMSKGSSI